MTASQFIYGDPHRGFDELIRAAEAIQPLAIFLLGDQTPARPLDEKLSPLGATPVYWIPGNHDTDDPEMMGSSPTQSETAPS